MSSKIFPSTGEPKPKFDPNAAYEAVQDTPVPKGNKPAFNPNKKFEVVKDAEVPQQAPEKAPAQQQPAFQVQLSEPTFKSAPASTGDRTFQYTEPSQVTDIYKLQGKARVAQDALHNELKNNKAALGRVVAYDRLKKQEEKRKLGLPTTAEDFNVDITDEDINKIHEEAKVNPHRAEQVLSAAVEINPEKANEFQANKYLIAAYNDASSDPNGSERVNKIEENAKKISKKELIYKDGLLGKPEGFFGSLITARNELNRLSDAYDYTKKMQSQGNEAGIIMGLNDRMKRDPDEPIGIPTGMMGHLAANIGGMPIKGIAAGLVASAGTSLLGNPEAAPAAFNLASAGVNANDMYKIGHQNALEQNYARIKSAHPEMPDYTAYKQAGELADKQAIIDAASAAAMQYLGAKVGFGAAKQLTKGISAGLSEIKDELGKKAFEALGVGGIGAGGQVVKNIMAQKAGLNVPTSEGAVDLFTTGVLMTGAMSMLGLAQNQIKNATKTKIASGLAKLPDNAIQDGLNKVQETGHLTPEQVENVKNIIQEQKILESSIPEDLPETDRLKIGNKIKERSALKQQLETVDEAYHPELKEKVKKLNEEILNISKGSERGELQSLVHKEIKDGNVQGFATEALRHAGEGELKQYMKEIAEQAHDPNSEAATIVTFGENIVNKAKELYPKEEPKQSSISVIPPGEIKQPEAITISPKEPTEKIGNVEVSEHGEDTKTAAGEENGVKPSKLTDAGRKEAEELGQYLVDNNKKKIIVSEVERAQETANVAAQKADVPIETNPILNTWDIGHYDGKPEGSFVEEAWVDKPTEAPKGGESFNDFTKRMEQAYDYVKSLPEDNHVVTHSKVMRALDALSKTDGKWTEETTKEFLNNKELTHAVPIEKSDAMDVRQQAANGEGVGAGNVQSEGPAGEEIGGQTKEEGNDKGKEKVGEPEMVGITHAQMDQISRELGLPEYTQDPETMELWDKQAKERMAKDPDAMNKVIAKLRNGEGVDKVETRMMIMHMAELKGKYDANPTPELLAQIARTKDLFNISGREKGKELVARKGALPADENSLSDFHLRDIEFNKGAPLTEKQTAQSTKEFQEIKAAKEALEKKMAKMEADRIKEKAEKKLQQEVKTTKKDTKKDYKSERNNLFEQLKKQKEEHVQKLKDQGIRTMGGGLVLTGDMAKTIAKIIKSYAEEGVHKLDELVKVVHEGVKDIIDGITEDDIRDVIAGEYDKKKPPKSKLAAVLYDLKTEQKLINELDQLLNGEMPKNENKKRQRNQQIEALRQKIKELKDVNPEAPATKKRIEGLEAELQRLKERREKEPTIENKRQISQQEEDLKKQIAEEKKKWAAEEKMTPEQRALQSLKGRYKSKIADIENKIKNGDFGPDEKPEPIELDKEGQELKDRYIEAKKERELRLAKQEYEDRPFKQRAADFALGVLDLRRMVGTAFDFSVPFRQALPVTINPLKIKTTALAFKNMFSHFYSAKNLDRWWFDLENSADYKEMLDDGVPIHSPDDLRISKREEEFRTKLAEKIPVVGAGVKMSNRAASGYLNSMRADLYRKGREILEAKGITRDNSPDVYQALGNDIANLTGSGKLLPFLEGKPAKALGSVFFGARLMAAKFNLLNPITYAKMPKPIMKQALRDLAIRTGMYITAGYLAKAAGFGVSLDPNDKDFMKIKHGETTYDITGGEAIYIRTFLRVLGAAHERITGEEKSSLKTAEKAGSSVTSFFRNKLAPTPSYAIDAFMGKKATGEKFDPYDIVRVYPMWIDDIVDDWHQDGATSILTAAVPSIFGVGVMTIPPKKGGGSGGGAGATGRYSKEKKSTKANKPHKTHR